MRTLRWSNAAHPPPVLIAPDGRPRLLETPPDPLLGIGIGARADHVVTLEPGAGVVFYTDGLIERRGSSVHRGFESLVGLLDDGGARSADELCDHLLRELESTGDDDVALLVLRAGQEDVPRRSAAAPAIVSSDRPDRA